MNFKQLCKTRYLLRLDKKEELIKSLQEFAKKEDVKTAEFRGLGFVDKAKLFCYNHKTKSYNEQNFKGRYEITNLWGLITKDQYIHAHITLADETFQAKAGHLKEARVGGTAEIIIDVLGDEEISRFFDEETGLNLLKL